MCFGLLPNRGLCQGIGGIVDSIAACQAVDPGSIPGQCNRTATIGASFQMCFAISTSAQIMSGF